MVFLLENARSGFVEGAETAADILTCYGYELIIYVSKGGRGTTSEGNGTLFPNSMNTVEKSVPEGD